MAMAATNGHDFDLRALIGDVATRPARFDPFGFVTGYKAYQIYTALAARSDAELRRHGIDRGQLPWIAMDLAGRG